MGGAAGSAGKGGAAGSAGATGKGGSTGTAGAGGSAGKGGAAGSAGAAGSGGQAGGAGQGGVGGGVATATATLTVSACPNSVKNKGACAPGDDPCFNFCGPDKLGTKLCTCTSRAWDCQTCTFDAGVDYSCYRLPDRPRACAEEPVRPGEPCSFPACTPCGGVDAYLDSSNEAKDGYCVCSDLSTKRKWTCAAVREWPPQ
jgi:hypothetical protein